MSPQRMAHVLWSNDESLMKYKNLFDPTIFGSHGVGVHTGITDEEYHSIKAVSNSSIKLAKESFRKFKHYLDDGEWEMSDDMYKGKLVHLYVLQPKWAKENMVFTAIKGKNLKEYKALADENPGKIVMNRAESELVRGMSEEILANERIVKLLSGGRSEVTAFATCPKTGLMLKARVDFFDPVQKYILDFKTCENAKPSDVGDGGVVIRKFEKNAAGYSYHVQAAFYMHVFKLLGYPIENYIIIAQEKKAPYQVQDYFYTLPAIEKGEELFSGKLEQIAAQVKSDTFPGYSDRCEPLSIPDYLMSETW